MTCASWAVRRPYSLASRKTDSTVYNETEAARMYAEAATGRVGTRIIADTAEPQSRYQFLNTSKRSASDQQCSTPFTIPTPD